MTGSGKEEGSLKLEPELIPSPCWGADLSRVLSQRLWKQVRAPIVERAASHCEICGAEVSRLICHERWKYDDDAGIAYLRELIALCFKCSGVVHWGNSQALANAGEINMAGIWGQFMRVNGISREAAQEHLDHAFALWRQRSKQSWKIDYGEYGLWSARQIPVEAPQSLRLPTTILPEVAERALAGRR